MRLAWWMFWRVLIHDDLRSSRGWRKHLWCAYRMGLCGLWHANQRTILRRPLGRMLFP